MSLFLSLSHKKFSRSKENKYKLYILYQNIRSDQIFISILAQCSIVYTLCRLGTVRSLQPTSRLFILLYTYVCLEVVSVEKVASKKRQNNNIYEHTLVVIDDYSLNSVYFDGI